MAISLLSLFVMEGCRYNGMQWRLPEASQWMDRVKQRGDEERRGLSRERKRKNNTTMCPFAVFLYLGTFH